MLITRLLRSPTLMKPYRLISLYRPERSLCSLNDLENRSLKRYAISLAENMETTRLGLTIILPYLGFHDATEELLVTLETINPAVKYVPFLNDHGD